MGKKISIDIKRNLPKIFVGIIVLVLGVIAIRVLLWEYSYYQEKEGSERAKAVSSPVTEEETISEEEITQTETDNYTVSPDRPRYLSIERLDVKNARVLPVGLTNSRQIQTPNNIFDVGWYTGSDRPGEGGTAVFDGHNGGPTKVGVFKYLPTLANGDIITIERGDGKIFRYNVVENVSYTLSEANANMNKAFVSPVPGVESITLITCSGEWSDVQKTYLSRQFVRAVLLADTEQ